MKNTEIITLNNLQTRIYKNGKGEPLFLIPGWRTDIERMLPFLNFLSNYFLIYTLDLPGVGKTEELEEISIKNYALFFIEFIKFIKKRDSIKRFYLSGVSMGAQILVNALLKKDIEKNTKGVILFMPLYNKKCFKFSSIKTKGIEILINMLLKRPFFNIGDKIYKSKKLMKLLIKFTDKDNDLKKKKNLEYHINSFRRFSFKTNIMTLKSLLSEDLNKIKKRFTMPIIIIMSKEDPLLRFQETIKNYKKKFLNLYVEELNENFHAPRRVITNKFIEKNFKNSIDRTIDLFKQYNLIKNY